MKARKEARALHAQLNPKLSTRTRYHSTQKGKNDGKGVGLPPMWLLIPCLVIVALCYLVYRHSQVKSEERYDVARHKFWKLLLSKESSEAMMHLKMALRERTMEEKAIGFREVALSIFRMSARRSDDRLVLPPELRSLAESICGYLVSVLASTFAIDERIKLLLEMQDFYDSMGSMQASAYIRAEAAKLILTKDKDFESQRLLAMLSVRGRLSDDSVDLMEAGSKHARTALQILAKGDSKTKGTSKHSRGPRGEAMLEGLIAIADEEAQLRRKRRDAEKALANGTLQDILPQPLFTKVDRRSNLTYDEFISQYVMQNQPVIITDYGIPRIFPNLEGSDDPWKLISEQCGSMYVEVVRHVADEWSAWGRLVPEFNLTRLDRFLREMDKPGMAGAYVFDKALNDVGKFGCSTLVQKLVMPKYFAQDVLKRKIVGVRHREDPFEGHPAVLVGAANSSCGLHIDRFESHFWQAVVAGQKQWRVFAIPQSWRKTLLYEHVGLGTLPVAPDDDEERLARYPLSRVAAQYQVDFEVHAGEMVFIPGGTAHSVRNPQKSLAFSMNYMDHTNAAAAAKALSGSPRYEELGGRLKTAKLHAPVEANDLPWEDFVPGRGQRRQGGKSGSKGIGENRMEL
eukprot:gnl/MRDRNA2_/MRDRNA2_27711_c0_seq1.p1 gnl/MRDRNA2_/MRDRNA2_27711_c0~~gnl/MRDRNA2_/MRDRNA2_27711_c0_seq1.p1  ORF type:complete len:628 (+),score=111.25 gnl/MRDRNA2_/MRDRNA2_27711_c0_seq1:83-1966(+)